MSKYVKDIRECVWYVGRKKVEILFIYFSLYAVWILVDWWILNYLVLVEHINMTSEILSTHGGNDKNLRLDHPFVLCLINRKNNKIITFAKIIPTKKSHENLNNIKVHRSHV